MCNSYTLGYLVKDSRHKFVIERIANVRILYCPEWIITDNILIGKR